MITKKLKPKKREKNNLRMISPEFIKKEYKRKIKMRLERVNTIKKKILKKGYQKKRSQ